MESMHAVQARLRKEVAHSELGIQQGESKLLGNKWLVSCGKWGKGIDNSRNNDSNPQRLLSAQYWFSENKSLQLYLSYLIWVVIMGIKIKIGNTIPIFHSLLCYLLFFALGI